MPKKYLSRWQAAGCNGFSGFIPRPGTDQWTRYCGPIRRDAVTILHAEGPRLGRIETDVRCTWIENGRVRRLDLPFEVHFPDGRLPALIAVLGDKEAQKKQLQQTLDQIEARLLSEFQCSALYRWTAASMRAGHRLSNARLLTTAGTATSAERIAVVAALRDAGGVAPASEVMRASGLEDAWLALLRTILAGDVRLVDPNARLNRDALVTF